MAGAKYMQYEPNLNQKSVIDRGSPVRYIPKNKKKDGVNQKIVRDSMSLNHSALKNNQQSHGTKLAQLNNGPIGG